MSKSVRSILIIIISFAAYFILDEFYFRLTRKWLNQFIHQAGISHIIAYTISGIPLFAGTLLIRGKGKFLEGLGINKPLLTGLVFALICVLPMHIIFAILFAFNGDVKFTTILITVLAAGFFEELYFRGFLFGEMYRNTRLGFLLSVFFGAAIVALCHALIGSQPGEIAIVFSTTFLGGVVYSWVYVEWDYNLWVPIFLHMLVNLTWELFITDGDKINGLDPNLFLVMTIGLIVLMTIAHKLRKGAPIAVNKRTVWLKNNTPQDL